MIAKIQKWGNSQGLRLSKRLLEDARMDVGEEVDLRVEDGSIIITPRKRDRGARSLEELVARIRPDYQPNEVDWGKPLVKAF